MTVEPLALPLFSFNSLENLLKLGKKRTLPLNRFEGHFHTLSQSRKQQMKIAVAILSKSYWNSQDNHPSIFFIFIFIYSHEQDADQLKFVPGG